MNTTTIICLNLIANHLNFKQFINKQKKKKKINFILIFLLKEENGKNEKIYQKKKKLINKNIKNIQ